LRLGLLVQQVGVRRVQQVVARRVQQVGGVVRRRL
jgi:hypothetical protein